MNFASSVNYSIFVFKLNLIADIIYVVQIERLQSRLPHSLSSDALMANCTWEYMVLWNKDAEVRHIHP